MKRTALISVLAALVLMLSLSFAAQGKDDYETPIIPVVSSVTPSGVSPAEQPSDPYETPIIPADPTTPEADTPAADGNALLQLFTAVLSFFRWIFSLIGGFFA